MMEVGNSVVNSGISQNNETRIYAGLKMLTNCPILKHFRKWMNDFEQLTGAVVIFVIYKD